MKIVLALAPVWDSITPPLSLAFLKSSLMHAGYECKCIDFSIQFRPIMVSALGDEAAEEYIARHPEFYHSWAKQICEEKPDVVGFSLLVSNLNNTRLLAKEVRKMLPEVVIVTGGPSLTRQNGNTIERAHRFSDYIVEGEGENNFVELVRCIEQKGDVTKVKQLWLKAPDGTVYYTGAGIEQNIDSIPFPDFTDFDRKDYRCPDRLPVLFSRGCILNCNYCENKWNHLTQRSRSGRNVFEELKRDVKEYGIKEYMFNDDSLISYKTFKQLEEYCDLVIAEGLTLPWSVYGTRVERKLTEDYVRKLRRSGMERVSLGVESFSSKVQHDMGKSSKYDDADKTCRLFANQGIKTESWIIYGYPTETDADFDETLHWFIKNPNILSHVTANTFGPNAKYHNDRPGMVKYHSSRSWDWSGPESTLEKRKKRFLLLIEVLEEIRRVRKGEFTFYFGDPLYVKYFSAWGKKEKEYLFRRWDELQGILRKETGLQRVLHFFKMGKINGCSIAAQHNYALHQADPDADEKPAVVESVKELIIDGSADELRARLYAKMKNWLSLSNHRSEEQERILEEYKDKIQRVYALVADRIPEEIAYAMSLQGDTDKLISDLNSCSCEVLAKRITHLYQFLKVKYQVSNGGTETLESFGI
ncbi:MAG TPA: radical SAM protein [Chitinophagales bacterium]|nr:radical SAM protein [Chitinophagales bacterium]